MESKTMKKLLLVDDDPNALTVLSMIFSRKGYGCNCCSNSTAALAAMKEDPDQLVIIIDAKMPGLDGKQLLKEIKKFHRSAKVLMMSASPQDERELYLLGALGFYDKMDDKEKLLEQITDIEQDKRTVKRLTTHCCFLAGDKPAVALNISCDGMLFQSRTEHKVGALLDISLISKDEFLDVKGRVVRSDLYDSLYHVALYFQENIGHFLQRNQKLFL
jgi:CheY-like chemotaxis protein